MKRRVLVPLDGSDLSETALPLARRLAEPAGSVLELVTVYDRGAVPVEEWDAAYPGIARAYLHRIAETLEDDDLEVEASFLEGDPAEQIAALAERGAADFIVMSTHGRGPFSRFWLGSVADALVRMAPVPLILSRPRNGGPPRTVHVPGLDRILVPLDGSENAEAVLPVAAALGRDLDTRYVLLRVIRYPDEMITAYAPSSVQVSQRAVEDEVQVAEEYLERLIANLEREGLTAEAKVVVDSRPASTILCQARERDVDLIAMTTHGRGGMSRLLMGSVTDKIVRGAHAPVLVVRGSDEPFA